MSLFQVQPERQFQHLLSDSVHLQYEKYQQYFGNPLIQENIRKVSEEQYQGEFIQALFVGVPGYIAQPVSGFNLIREMKNETDSKSADAAVLINNKVVCVVELKDHKIQDLKKVEIQAFGYKNNHRNCRYVVTSNFEHLRFYIENAVDYILSTDIYGFVFTLN
ncbi:MAG: type I restriction enzyme HsdR N-terminal domain-containing protein [Paludibacteraceae bacterium]|nr:type I restriction enzyme HsdR N-terminal domain-containing protein [Paludibacteraceae bacterium]